MTEVPQPRGSAAERLTDGFNLVVDALALNGIETIYGVVGIPITDLARIAQARGDALHRVPPRGGGRSCRRGGRVFDAESRRLLTVSAPGFLNGLVALANATTNCFPAIQISGSSERAIIDLKQGDYEELDQFAVARQLAKAAYRVERVEDIGTGVARAIRTAVSGRPGGVYLDLPAAVLSATIDAETGRESLVEVVDPAPRQLAAPEAVDRALGLLGSARRPLIVLGKGAAYARAEDEIRQFVEATGIPFLPMSMAKGLLPDDHPQAAIAARRWPSGSADVVMLVGARLNWLLGHGRAPQWSPDCRFVQLDVSARELDSNRPIAAPLVGDIKSVMGQLVAALRPGQVAPAKEWLEELEARKAQNVARMAERLDADARPMNFFGALRAIRDVLAEHPGTLVVNEGANTLDFGRDVLSMSEPRHRLDSGTWGVMGVGLGYAIGAAVESAATGRRGRRGQRLRVQRHGAGDDLPLPAADRDRDLQQRRRVQGRRNQSALGGPGTHGVAAVEPLRAAGRGLRRQRLLRRGPQERRRRHARGPGFGQARGHQLPDRPHGRHRERPPAKAQHRKHAGARPVTRAVPMPAAAVHRGEANRRSHVKP